MSPSRSRARDRVTVPVLLIVVAIVAVGVLFRVRFLEDEMMTRWRAVLEGGSLTTQATVDEWYGERVADAEALANSVGLHANVPHAELGPPLKTVFAPLMRRGRFVRVWIVDSTGNVLERSHPDSLYSAERTVLANAVAARRVMRSAIVPRGAHEAYLSFAAPVRLSGVIFASGRVPAAVILRADVIHSFAPWAAGRPNAAMSMLATPDPKGPVIIAACPEASVPVCIRQYATGNAGTPSMLALAQKDTFGIFVAVDGMRVLAHTRYDDLLQWGVVRRVQYTDAVVPLYREIAIEGAFLTVLLALAGVGAYAANRGRRVRWLGDQRDAARWLRAVVDASTDGLVSLDAEFRITMVNDAVERMLGRSSVSIVGRPVLTLFPEAWHTPIQDSLASFPHAQVTHAALTDPTRCVALCEDGRSLPVEVSVGRAMLRGAPLFVLGLRDVAERVRSEQFLHGQRTVLELMAGGAPATETMAALLSVVENEAPTMRCAVYELIDTRQIARIVAAPGLPAELIEVLRELPTDARSSGIGAAMHRGEQVSSENFSADPLWRDLSSSLSAASVLAGTLIPLKSADGRIIGALACFYAESRLATPREQGFAGAVVHLASIALGSARAAAAIRTSEAGFRSFVENAPAAIFRETRRGELVSTNAAMSTLLGYPDHAALATAAAAGRVYHDAAARTALLRALEATDVVRGVDVEWRHLDGAIVTVRLSARAYRDEHSRVWLWEGYAEDVTPLRLAERALRRSERMAAVGKLVSGVAHELNNPLSSIMHFTEDLLADPRSAQDREALGVIRDQARRSRTIVRDLLSFVQQRRVSGEALSLTDVAASTTLGMRPGLQRAGVTLHLADTGDTPVLADRAGIEQIVANLVSNAAYASGRGGDVWVRTESVGPSCHLIVEDSGPDIPDDVLSHIFDPFFTTKPTGEGTGLGLSVTLGIVEQLDGRITVDKNPAGRGTRFTVILPRTSVKKARPSFGTLSSASIFITAPVPVGANDAAPARTQMVLIIDDEPSIRAALRRFFTRRGWTVVESADGRQGLESIHAAAPRFDMVISDLRMPGLSGIELHDRLLESHPALLERFVFSTGDVASADAASFVRRTSCPVLQKPFELRVLDDIIQGYADGISAEHTIV